MVGCANETRRVMVTIKMKASVDGRKSFIIERVKFWGGISSYRVCMFLQNAVYYVIFRKVIVYMYIFIIISAYAVQLLGKVSHRSCFFSLS